MIIIISIFTKVNFSISNFDLNIASNRKLYNGCLHFLLSTLICNLEEIQSPTPQLLFSHLFKLKIKNTHFQVKIMQIEISLPTLIKIIIHINVLLPNLFFIQFGLILIVIFVLPLIVSILVIHPIVEVLVVEFFILSIHFPNSDIESNNYIFINK